MIEQFDRLHGLPDGFFDITSANIRTLFPNPTLIQLDGRDTSRFLYISILLHGNEYSGLRVMQRVLANHRDELPRSILLFVGNVRAAEANLRHLPDQVDYNRCWPGTLMEPCPTSQMMRRIIEIAHGLPLFAAIDIHNNTGRNPHYACISDPNGRNQNLAAMFNSIAMVFQHRGVSTLAFDGICPAATLECGLPGDPDGIEQACRLIEELLVLDGFSDEAPSRDELLLVESHLDVHIPRHVSYEFDPAADVDLRFERDIESRNFELQNPQQAFAYTRVDRPLQVLDDDGHDITDQVLRVEDGKVYFNQTLMPAMITRDKLVIQQDCFCHLLQDYLPHAEEL